MRVFRGFDDLPEFKSPVATLGSYDGVHIGHRYILSKLVDTAKRQSGESVLLTLYPHPREVLRGEKVPSITTLEEKMVLLEHLGLDNLIIIPFTEEFSKISSQEFVDEYIIGKLGVQKIYIGYDHRFGYKQTGGYEFLKGFEESNDFQVEMIAPFKLAEGEVSSTAIRNFIEKGDMKDAKRYLGYAYFFEAISKSNDKLSKKINIELPEVGTKLLPPIGTYKVVVRDDSGDTKSTLTIEKGEKLYLTFDESKSLNSRFLVIFS